MHIYIYIYTYILRDTIPSLIPFESVSTFQTCQLQFTRPTLSFWGSFFTLPLHWNVYLAITSVRSPVFKAFYHTELQCQLCIAIIRGPQLMSCIYVFYLNWRQFVLSRSNLSNSMGAFVIVFHFLQHLH